jgi:hypothetical protein
MKIGIDVSQLAYENTGVAVFLISLVENLIKYDKKNKYVLFYSSLRKNIKYQISNIKSNSSVEIKRFRMPPTLLDLIWNKLHIFPIEMFIGDVDLFITSDWTEPPTRKAKKATILYDLIVYKYPTETHHQTKLNPFRLTILPNIVSVQRRKLNWVKKESNIVFCISEATKQDATSVLGIDQEKLRVIYPGI